MYWKYLRDKEIFYQKILFIFYKHYIALYSTNMKFQIFSLKLEFLEFLSFF